jgi:hypothetical protein
VNTPAASRHRIALDRATRSHRGGSGANGKNDGAEIGSTGGKRMVGVGGGARRGMTFGRRLG